jgi:hypothetical protein
MIVWLILGAAQLEMLCAAQLLGLAVHRELLLTIANHIIRDAVTARMRHALRSTARNDV